MKIPAASYVKNTSVFFFSRVLVATAIADVVLRILNIQKKEL